MKKTDFSLSFHKKLIFYNNIDFPQNWLLYKKSIFHKKEIVQKMDF